MNLTELRILTRSHLNDAVKPPKLDGFWTQSEVDTAINVAVAKIHGTIAGMDRQAFTTKATFATVSGSRSYNVPVGLYSIERIEHVDTGEIIDPTILDEEGAYYVETMVMTPGRPYMYLVRNNFIDLLPTPDGVYSLVIYYQSGPAKLILPNDIPAIPEIHHDLIAIFAALTCSFKNAEVRQDLMQMYREREYDLVKQIAMSGQGNPHVHGAYED